MQIEYLSLGVAPCARTSLVSICSLSLSLSLSDGRSATGCRHNCLRFAGGTHTTLSLVAHADTGRARVSSSSRRSIVPSPSASTGVPGAHRMSSAWNVEACAKCESLPPELQWRFSVTRSFPVRFGDCGEFQRLAQCVALQHTLDRNLAQTLVSTNLKHQRNSKLML